MRRGIHYFGISVGLVALAMATNAFPGADRQLPQGAAAASRGLETRFVVFESFLRDT